MKLPRLLFAFLACVALGSAAPAAAASKSPASGSSGPVYELRTYTATPANLDKVAARFRNDTVRIFEKHGMKNIGYWIPMDEKDGSGDKLVYLLEHASRDAAKASWKSFSSDPQWQEVRKRTEANGKIVAKAESVFLEPTNYSPVMKPGKGKGAPRVFELRTYAAAEGKLPALDARFRDHTLKIFAKHGMTNLGYFHPTDADKGAGNTLVYFLAHANRDAAAASWKAFRDDPGWVKARTASEKDGKLTTKVQSVFLTPTDFSTLK
ncbi:MAG: NIPSNAP family protein [Opitutaceae bacterium]|nr:NIPSNAP family protein [Opitutaceae bacterium]